MLHKTASYATLWQPHYASCVLDCSDTFVTCDFVVQHLAQIFGDSAGILSLCLLSWEDVVCLGCTRIPCKLVIPSRLFHEKTHFLILAGSVFCQKFIKAVKRSAVNRLNNFLAKKTSC